MSQHLQNQITMLADAVREMKAKLDRHDVPGPYFFLLHPDAPPAMRDAADKIGDMLGVYGSSLLYRLRPTER